jgi:hypothetical protein
MVIRSVFPMALLIFANSTLAYDLVNPKEQVTPRLPQTEQASVDIRPTSDGHVVAVVKNSKNHPNTIFALKTKERVTLSSTLTITNAEITYNKDYVVFASKTDGKNVVFKLTSNSRAIPGNNIGVFNGFGLIHEQQPTIFNRLTSWTNPVTPPVDELVKCDCVQTSIPDQGGCIAGGEGATSCSYSENVGGGTVVVGASCEVNCAVGFYACCYEN